MIGLFNLLGKFSGLTLLFIRTIFVPQIKSPNFLDGFIAQISSSKGHIKLNIFLKINLMLEIFLLSKLSIHNLFICFPKLRPLNKSLQRKVVYRKDSNIICDKILSKNTNNKIMKGIDIMHKITKSINTAEILFVNKFILETNFSNI